MRPTARGFQFTALRDKKREVFKVLFLLLTSSRFDKYDRYLSDVYVPLDSKSTVHPSSSEAIVQYDGEEYLYLNNELLLRGFAKRMTV